jgi:hypothetical protein
MWSSSVKPDRDIINNMSLNYGEENITMTTRSYSEEHPKKLIMGWAQWYQYNSYTGQNHRRSLFKRCSNSQQPQHSLHHHQEPAEVHRLERRAHKNMSVENGPQNTTSTTHNMYYPKLITQKTVTSWSPPCYIYSYAESTNRTHNSTVR